MRPRPSAPQSPPRLFICAVRMPPTGVGPEYAKFGCRKQANGGQKVVQLRQAALARPTSFERRVFQLLRLGHEIVRNLLKPMSRRQMWTDPRKAGACLRRFAQISYELLDHDCSFHHGERTRPADRVVAAICVGGLRRR